MRLILSLALCVFALCFPGCESVDALSSRVHDRFEAPQPQTRLFEVEQRAVFEAAQIALRRIDFQVTRAAAAQGIIKAMSRVQPGNSMGEARQFSFEVNIQDIEAGKTQVSAILREQQESSSFAGATDIPLREHGLYDSFFAALAQALKEKAVAPAKTE